MEGGSEEIEVLRLNRDVVECSLEVELGKLGVTAVVNDAVDDLIQCEVCYTEVIFADKVINGCTWHP